MYDDNFILMNEIESYLQNLMKRMFCFLFEIVVETVCEYSTSGQLLTSCLATERFPSTPRN